MSRLALTMPPITAEYLDYDEVIARYDVMMDWLAGLYVNVLNLIQYMHDKYYYEAAEMALIDTDVRRTFATGIAGFSHVVDSPERNQVRQGQSACVTRPVWSPITRSRANSPVTATMTTAPMISLSGCCAPSWRRSSAATPTATPRLPPLS